MIDIDDLQWASHKESDLTFFDKEIILFWKGEVGDHVARTTALEDVLAQ
jgi:hypothetical protein